MTPVVSDLVITVSFRPPSTSFPRRGGVGIRSAHLMIISISCVSPFLMLSLSSLRVDPSNPLRIKRGDANTVRQTLLLFSYQSALHALIPPVLYLHSTRLAPLIVYRCFPNNLDDFG